MKRAKRLTALMLVLAMTLALTGCGNSSVSESDAVEGDSFDSELEETGEVESGEVIEEENDEAEENDSLQIGESGISYDEEGNPKLEITLINFSFVNSIYDYSFYPLDISNTQAGEGYTIAAVTYTVKNVGKTVAEIDCGFGQVEYGDGYIYSDSVPSGIYTAYSDDQMAQYDDYGGGLVSIVTGYGLELQPLSEAAEVKAFLEVPIALTENLDEPLYYEVLGVKFEIPSSCRSVKAEIEVGDILNADDFNSKLGVNYLGSKVSNYEAQNGADIEWEIFYAGPIFVEDTESEVEIELTEPRIYLIATDYVSKEFIPEECAHASYDFKFILRVPETHQTGSKSITDERMRALNAWYFITLAAGSGESTGSNISKVAGMLDAEIWSGFTDKNGNAEYAIGGPTLELLFDSYNDYCFEGKSVSVLPNIGYYWSSVEFLKGDGLYVIPESDKANAYWVASPAGSDDPIDALNCENVVTVTYWGEICASGANILCGFRPVVCLNADVQLQKTENGDFVIVDQS